MKLDLGSNLIDRLRLASILDGVSFLILLAVAMPLKYLAGMPMAVRLVGSIHGILFVVLCLCLLAAWMRRRLPLRWCVTVLACAVVPAAPFFLDRHLQSRRLTTPSPSPPPTR